MRNFENADTAEQRAYWRGYRDGYEDCADKAARDLGKNAKNIIEHVRWQLAQLSALVPEGKEE